MVQDRHDKVIFKEECYKIQGAIFEVYREMGKGFLESVYQECLISEFTEREIPFISQPELTLSYKGKRLDHSFRPDIVCYEKIILELKSVKTLLPEHTAQVYNYLKITGFKLGLLVNFGHYPKVQIQRIVL